MDATSKEPIVNSRSKRCCIAILPGQYFDAETGLHQNWFRDYDPTIGRYLQSDPSGLDDGVNTYAYTGSNPTNWIDLDGAVRRRGGPARFFDPKPAGSGSVSFGRKPSYNKPPPDTVPVPADVERKVICIQNCLGRQLRITGGAETKGHGAESRHYVGEAVDFGFNSNPGIQNDPKLFFCCAKKCGFKFGQTEGGKGPHFHLQVGPGKYGGSGEIPKDGSEACECKGIY